jgi:hypothetical protein
MVAIFEQEGRKHTEAFHALGCKPNFRRDLLVKVSLHGLDGHRLRLLEKVALRLRWDLKIRIGNQAVKGAVKVA